MNVICLQYCNEVDTDEEFIFNEVIQNQNQQAVDMELHSERVTVDGPITEHGCLLVSEKLATNSSHLSDSGCNEIKLTGWYSFSAFHDLVY
jgi:hypothetical protein